MDQSDGQDTDQEDGQGNKWIIHRLGDESTACQEMDQSASYETDQEACQGIGSDTGQDANQTAEVKRCILILLTNNLSFMHGNAYLKCRFPFVGI